MEINFKKLSIEDKTFIDTILKDSQKRFCEYTFGNMFCWGARYGIELFCTQNGFITGNLKTCRFNYPAGKDSDAIIQTLINNFDSFTLTSLSEQEAEHIKSEFDGFETEPTPEKFDYIYLSEKLQSLSGKKLAAKRNHINAFLADGEWKCEPVTEQNIQSLKEFNKLWCGGLCEDNPSLATEMCAVDIGLDNFASLGYEGLILYKNGKICAYSFGEPINDDTYCVHVEKADSDVRGAYQMINREFARTYCKDYMYINREDDAGDQGLRRAKLSYYPTGVGTKWKATFKK